MIECISPVFFNTLYYTVVNMFNNSTVTSYKPTYSTKVCMMSCGSKCSLFVFISCMKRKKHVIIILNNDTVTCYKPTYKVYRYAWSTCSVFLWISCMQMRKHEKFSMTCCHLHNNSPLLKIIRRNRQWCILVFFHLNSWLISTNVHSFCCKGINTHWTCGLFEEYCCYCSTFGSFLHKGDGWTANTGRRNLWLTGKLTTLRSPTAAEKQELASMLMKNKR